MIHSFNWLLPGRLAGFGFAGWQLTEPDLVNLHQAGVGAVVSLTEQPVHHADDSVPTMRYRHLPIPDMTTPRPAQIDLFVQFVDDAAGDGLATAVHCRAGLGRTGTMLACYLVAQGSGAEEALGEVRQHRPGSVETAAQEEAVRSFAQRLATRRN
jgi:atypical dual specificity phosphatase